MVGPVRTLFRRLRRLSAYTAKLRYILTGLSFDRAGRRGSIGRNVRITGDLRIVAGNRVAIRDGVILGGNGRLTIGDNTAINTDCVITALESVEIGANVMLAPRVYVLDVDHRFDSRKIPIRQQGYVVRPVVIEDDVWIGAGTVITRGVRVGKGAIIGANSVVTGDIPPYAVAAGAPARVIRERPA